MSQETETLFSNRTNWNPGPWDSELDKYQWVDEQTGLDCLIVRGPLGALCGYVGIPESHPLYGQDYFDVPVGNVHGGLTFANSCQEGGHICHVPEPGRPDNVWWFGFDCAHSRDLIPGMTGSVLSRDGTYRDVAYVKSECADLAQELLATSH